MQSSQTSQENYYTAIKPTTETTGTTENGALSTYAQSTTTKNSQNLHQTMEIVVVSLSLLIITLLLVWIFCLRKRWQKNRVAPHQKLSSAVDLEKGYAVSIHAPPQAFYHPFLKSQPLSIVMPEKSCDTNLVVVFAGQTQSQSQSQSQPQSPLQTPQRTHSHSLLNKPTRRYSSPFVDIPFRALMHSAIRTPILTNSSLNTLPRVKLPRHPMGRLYGRRAVSFTPSRKVPLQIACWMVSRKNKSAASWYETQTIENDNKYKRSSV
ncbi:hypothetical protein F4703DRAFT_1852202 [Phycomyces blakesleeanus]|uniref:Uncharacterized protein n=1 Tax=Phycomyces blakesleeanus (strain ATCC 8743b / DSM 1359 / FGSC 10004 / NBRC 33097 / NRRL 1555) TaxID=763407 RepID=A0A167N9I3_PHYB8|nr:hypothetical protein PHYBLDRAFT_166661 [Phycomyces blakesleeanus NRRL 1555(-)]OAD75414.1 hypothetical protein PHYBLDRAFT_166661 [Phycomyces blakesleeanus NRRL 1555(-)]|eukprot:XP_018293454.1 hypothetical protein PHYBLDRAFT_166661 [Phycomyces blakesleeanus NRRL 1555(-)]